MELEPRDEFEPQSAVEAEFERELRQAFEQRPAPPRLKKRILEEAARRRAAGRHMQAVWWQRIAAGLLLAAVVGGGVWWRHEEVRRQGEAARAQVLTALRITGHALNEINSKLAERDGENRDGENQEK